MAKISRLLLSLSLTSFLLNLYILRCFSSPSVPSVPSVPSPLPFWTPSCLNDPADPPLPTPGYDVIVVTMCFGLGHLIKDDELTYDIKEYLSWMNSWAGLNNTVLAYFDEEVIMNHFVNIRESQPPERTVVQMVSQHELKAFRDLGKISAIFMQPNYPKHYPNTVLPEYSATMNAKVDVLEMALDFLEEAEYNFSYVAWLDIGCFHSLKDFYQNTNIPFKLEAPEGFSQDGVSFSLVGDRDFVFRHSPWEIIQQNLVWVSGAFMAGTGVSVRKYIEDYRAAVEELLRANMSSSDQQVIAALHSGRLSVQPSTRVHGWNCSSEDIVVVADEYSCLAYVFAEAADRRCRERPKSSPGL